MKNVGFMGILRVIEDDGSVTFISEGDYVTCYVGDSAYYIGQLTKIGYWQTANTETIPIAIAIESKSSNTGSSTSVVLISDIKCIHKMTEKELQKVEKVISKISQTKFTGNKKSLKNYEK